MSSKVSPFSKFNETVESFAHPEYRVKNYLKIKILGGLKSIEKSRIVIDDYPNSKYLYDAFYLVGKSSFIKDDYQYAEKHFRQLLTEYPKSKFVTESI